MAILRPSSSPATHASNNLSNLMVDWLKDIDVTMFRSCVTCRNYANDKTCLLFQKDPPGSVVIKGCDRYVDPEEVPF